MDTESHLLLGAAFGCFATGELSYADPLRQHAPDYSLTLFDRAYFSAAFLLRWQSEGTGRHWLMRAKSPLRYEVIRSLAEGDEWIRMPVSPQARKQHPDLPEYWEARLVECMINGKAHRFLTSIEDQMLIRHHDWRNCTDTAGKSSWDSGKSSKVYCTESRCCAANSRSW
jgi:hypothetical protein